MHRRNDRRHLTLQCLESRFLLAAEPIISEFLASNQNSLVDEEGETSDWIEIRNVGDDALDLEGWHLTDDESDLAKWVFPTTLLRAGGHLVVFASGKDRIGSGPAGEHHTNFRLSRDGEFLALVQTDGIKVASEFSPHYPIQFEDVSYGPSADLSSIGFFRQPTPGSLNSNTPLSDPHRNVLISEIMYHPASHAVEDEYIEIFNAGLAEVDLNDWRIQRGVDFLFPDVTIQPQQYLVVAADPDRFALNYPGVDVFAGGWSGRLSNSGELIELVDDSGQLVDGVEYADEGDWSTRQRGPVHHGARGWAWSNLHDGGGRSLELVAVSLSNAPGQNWQASTTEKGTPGGANSVATLDSPPLILETKHSPIIPNSTDDVIVTARLVDELSTGLSAQVWWRVDGAADFSAVTMLDDGQVGDAVSADGVYTARLPAQSDRTVVEFYIEAVDSANATRQWPAPTADEGQVANLLYQVDDAFDADAAWIPGRPVEYRQIMTAAERAEFAAMNRLSDAQMNATFISVTGTGIDVRYNVGVRYRGSGSRNGVTPNNRINIPHDRAWGGSTALNINWNVAPEQIAGSALFRIAGLPAAEAKAVRMLSNGTDLYNGRFYAHLEALGSEFANNHFPTDNNGNLYKGRRPNESPPGGKGAGLDYHGPEPGPYVSYTKLTNETEADYSDVIDLTARLNLSSDEDYVAEVSAVVDVDQWMRFFALNALLDNSEGGLVNGDPLGDDYAMYRGADEQFRMIPHDLDSLFGEVRREFFRARRNIALNRFFAQPEFLQKYVEQMRDLSDVLRSEVAATTLDEALRHVTPQNIIDHIKSFLVARGDFVLSQLPNTQPKVSVTTGLPTVGEFPRTTVPFLPLAVATTGGAQSVLVNGTPAILLDDGSWSLSGDGLALNPGINRILVQSFDGPNGGATEIARQMLDVWYDDGDMLPLSGMIVKPIVTWAAAAGPYHITGDVTVPQGKTLIIEPGTSVFFDPGTNLNVLGVLNAEGVEHQRIRFTSVPNAQFVPDRPDGVDGFPDGPPRWSGIHFLDSTAEENIIAHADIEYAQSSRGSIGLKRSDVVIDNVSFRGTHLRMIHADSSAYLIRNSFFSDMFAANEEPQPLGLDNGSEHITSVGTPAAGGRMVIQGNFFGVNKGHNDVIDAVSGRRPGPILQILDNTFMGAQDELIDLGGDVYVAGNHFVNVFKATETSDRGYANAISTGDAGEDATVVVARNVFWNVDHAINLKRENASIFENNTVVQVHDDFVDGLGLPNVGSAINLFVDEFMAVPGAGAYAADNIFWNVPRVFGNADLPAGKMNLLELNNNLLDPSLADMTIGDRSSTLLDLGPANRFSSPGFQDAAAGDFSLRPDSPARGTGSLGQDLGAMIRPGIWITGEPPTMTGSRNARLIVGGPGIFAYMFRVNEGPWSSELTIGEGFDPTRETIRTAEIVLDDLADGSYTVEVMGRDFAGEWQDEPTVSKTWVVNSSEARLVINEVLAKNFVSVDHFGSYPDLIELHNAGGVEMDLSGYSITDDPNEPNKYAFPTNTVIPAGNYQVLYADDASDKPGIHLGFSLRQGGEGVFLFDAQGAVVDSVEFGTQVRDFSIGRIGHDEQWQLTVPTFGTANVSQPVGDRSELRINEWLASSRSIVDADFVELFNPEPLPVSVANLFLSDEPAGNPQQHRVAPLSFIAAQGYVELNADGNEAAGPDHLNFRLSSDQEVIGLLREDGTILDQVLYFPQTTDVSQGRLDDEPGYAFFPLPTPGYENAGGEHLTNGIVISEVHYHPRATVDNALSEDDLEFIEIRNQFARRTDISNWRLHEAVDYRFADGTTIAPEGTIVVVAFDPIAEPTKAAAFRAQYEISSQVSLIGPYDGQLSNRVAIVELSRPADRGDLLSDNRYESVDLVRYRDELPWPDEADGTGLSLSRVDLLIVGSLPSNWLAASPTPGDDELSTLGDVDGDGVVDSHDIDALQAAIRAGAVDAIFDLDRNGVVDSVDATFLVQEILDTKAGDTNLDGNVDFADFLVLANNFGSAEAGWEQGDFDGDGNVLFSDFLALANSFGGG